MLILDTIADVCRHFRTAYEPIEMMLADGRDNSAIAIAMTRQDKHDLPHWNAFIRVVKAAKRARVLVHKATYPQNEIYAGPDEVAIPKSEYLYTGNTVLARQYGEELVGVIWSVKSIAMRPLYGVECLHERGYIETRWLEQGEIIEASAD